jgi:hypothetical protein
MSPSQIAALSPLLEDFSVELIDQLVKEASAQSDVFKPDILLEELAQEELLRFGRGRRIRVCEVLHSHRTNAETGFWINQLVDATAFHQIERSIQSKAKQEEQGASHNEREQEREELLETVDWTAYRFDKADDIDDVLSRIQAARLVQQTSFLLLQLSSIE